MSLQTATRPASDGRDDSRLEQLNRHTIELLDELRVAGTGGGLWFVVPVHRRRRL